MDLITVLLFFLLAVIFIKLLAVILHVGFYVLALPIKLLALAVAAILVWLVLIPLGVVAGLAGLIILPLALAGPLLPGVLLVGGLVWLLRRI